jgi:hypothetical protein
MEGTLRVCLIPPWLMLVSFLALRLGLNLEMHTLRGSTRRTLRKKTKESKLDLLLKAQFPIDVRVFLFSSLNKWFAFRKNGDQNA